MPHGMMWSNIVRSGSTFSAHPHAGVTSRPVRTDPEVGEGGDEHRFEPADIRDHVALAGPPLFERHDRVTDELTGSVVGDVATAIGIDELGADCRRITQHVGAVGA